MPLDFSWLSSDNTISDINASKGFFGNVFADNVSTSFRLVLRVEGQEKLDALFIHLASSITGSPFLSSESIKRKLTDKLKQLLLDSQTFENLSAENGRLFPVFEISQKVIHAAREKLRHPIDALFVVNFNSATGTTIQEVPDNVLSVELQKEKKERLVQLGLNPIIMLPKNLHTCFAIEGCLPQEELPKNAEDNACTALSEYALRKRLHASQDESACTALSEYALGKRLHASQDKSACRNDRWKPAMMWALLPTIAAAATIAYKPSVIGPLFSIKAGSALLGGYLAFTIIISRLINTDNALEYKAANAGTNVDVYLNTDLVQDTLEKFQKQKQDQLIERR
jgi:hypothetical protein